MSIVFQNMMSLTDRQREVYEFFVSFREEHGNSPTIRDVVKRFGFASPNGAMSHIYALEKKGWLIRSDGKASRNWVPALYCRWRSSPPVPGWYVCVGHESRELVCIRDYVPTQFVAFFGPIGGLE